ncbi:MAG: diguanylate cyclase [Arcobacteraceae bacterium]
MSTISSISQQTIENITNSNRELTPTEYSKEFCKLAKKVNLTTLECDYFQETLAKIEQNELEVLEGKTPETIYDLVDILIQRVPKKNIKNMSEMLQASMRPSISLSFGDDLKSFCIQIGDSPSLIFEESIQAEIKKFIQNRFHVDQKILAQKTADIARLISLMNKYLGDAIDSNNTGSTNVKNIKDQIESITHANSTKEDLHSLQTKLVEAAKNIEEEMNNVNKNLESGQNEVLVLRKKIEALESELKETQATSMVDHLTKTLNRRSFEVELKKVEARYTRNQEDYAIVFFDIDFFKKVNDTYGHDAGDVILKTFASLIKKLTRDTDIVARYGGEEFIAILSYKDPSELHRYIERIKTVVTKNKFVHQENKIEITFSAGVQIRSKNATAIDTVAQADKLLYQAKNSGRNKIIFWDKKEM